VGELFEMIISRTPMRVSFLGGGSDFRDFYRESYGAVVSTAINKYVYVIINPRPDKLSRLVYSKTELVSSVEEIRHEVIREAFKLLGIQTGIDVFYISDVPVAGGGTGLGSSAAFVVGTLKALYAYLGEEVSPERLAKEACQIELDILGWPVGKQDQYAVAYGGLNYFRFNADESVIVKPIELSSEAMERLRAHLLFLSTGLPSGSSSILSEQKNKIKDNLGNLISLVAMTDQLAVQLETDNFVELGALLHSNWLYKKQYASTISNSFLDQCYQLALDAGAGGGKILGAGGGGLFLFYCSTSAIKNQVRRVLPELKEFNFNFEKEGSKIVYAD